MVITVKFSYFTNKNTVFIELIMHMLGYTLTELFRVIIWWLWFSKEAEICSFINPGDYVLMKSVNLKTTSQSSRNWIWNAHSPFKPLKVISYNIYSQN
jgi:hypothetical protein